ncbi:hypothetical protein [Streptomyces sp. NPDC059918]|uniref:hypothetical protein n=1 Tax=unclassified Streptomyces TaxID=2593676 RepID=UPI00365DA0D6
MEGGWFPGGDVSVLDRLTTLQREVLRSLGDPGLQGRFETSRDIWGELRKVADEQGHDAKTVHDVLVDFQHTESLRAFVLLELRVSGDESEQAAALVGAARTVHWLDNGGGGGTRPGPSSRPAQTPAQTFAPAPGPAQAPAPAPPPAARRYTRVAEWDGDVWCAYDTERGRQVYLRSPDRRPADDAPWSEQPPRFRGLGPHGSTHWCGYDNATARWMYIAHASQDPPKDDAPGWTDAAPTAGTARDRAPRQDALALDEALQGLVNAVRSGGMALSELATPLRFVAEWRHLTELGDLAVRAADTWAVLDHDMGEAGRREALLSIARLRGCLERLGGRASALKRWPADWMLDDSDGPERYARMLELGCDDLRRAVRRVARATAGTPLAKAAGKGQGRSADKVRTAVGNLTNFAWAMGRERVTSETFADPLHTARRLAGIGSLHEGCHDLAAAMTGLTTSVQSFTAEAGTGAAYDRGLSNAQKVLRDYSKQLHALGGHWPAWGDDDEQLPAESPAAYAVMMRLGWQVLEAERRELRTFVGWKEGSRSTNMPPLKSPGNRKLAAVRATVPRQPAVQAALLLPDLDELRALANAMASEGWPPDALARPLAHLEQWRASSGLRTGYPLFRDRVADVARLYGNRQAQQEPYRGAVARLIRALEAIRTGLALLGSDWPKEWNEELNQLPAQTPPALGYLLAEGVRQLRTSARNPSQDLVGAAAPAPSGARRTPVGEAPTRRSGGAHGRRRARQRSAFSFGSLRRYLRNGP